MPDEFDNLDQFKRELRSLPNIKRDITNIIDISKLKKEMDRMNERQLGRRISR